MRKTSSVVNCDGLIMQNRTRIYLRKLILICINGTKVLT